MNTHRIAIVTGNRADYFLLLPLIRRLYEAQDMETLLMVSGVAGTQELALRTAHINEQGYTPDAVITFALKDDSHEAHALALGEAVQGMTRALARLMPDALIVLGDRMETLAAVQAAFILGIRVAHLHGGETTQGALDDGFRHCITKLSYWHMASSARHAQRIIQLGESPDRVFVVGAICADMLQSTYFLSREALGLKVESTLILCVLHPETAERNDPYLFAKAVADGITAYLVSHPQAELVLIEGNSDAGGKAIREVMQQFALQHASQVHMYPALTPHYTSLLAAADVVMGNSSSAIVEAPLLGTPTVNIGTRQAGREYGPSIVTVMAEPEAIQKAIEQALELDVLPAMPSQSPAGHIVALLRDVLAQTSHAGPKIFHDLEGA
jgi:UDP-N-acetylglucosamine 2-epimerase (non-hydrolysing)